jgi:hypothetical protein
MENSSMSKAEIQELILQKAKDAFHKGPGWSQEGVVLREVGEAIGKGQLDLTIQQIILDSWYDLFTEKKLGWGYDLDNPGSPFFHVRKTG